MLVGVATYSHIAEVRMAAAVESKSSQWESFADFLANAPPSSEYVGRDVARMVAGKAHLQATTISVYCEAECQRPMNFDSPTNIFIENGFQVFINFICRHCQNYHIRMSLEGRWEVYGGEFNCYVCKVGQSPPFGPHIPAKLLRLIQADHETFLKGCRAESLNLGIGAFAYYRRVVENQKDRLCDAIIKVARKLNYPKDIIDDLEASKANWQFKQGVEGIKDAIPEAFAIGGHNPLTLLHNALSEGVHSLSDEECLLRAQDARTVLTVLAERLSDLSRDHGKLSEAVARLASRKK